MFVPPPKSEENFYCNLPHAVLNQTATERSAVWSYLTALPLLVSAPAPQSGLYKF